MGKIDESEVIQIKIEQTGQHLLSPTICLVCLNVRSHVLQRYVEQSCYVSSGLLGETCLDVPLCLPWKGRCNTLHQAAAQQVDHETNYHGKLPACNMFYDSQTLFHSFDNQPHDVRNKKKFNLGLTKGESHCILFLVPHVPCSLDETWIVPTSTVAGRPAGRH